LPKQFDKTTLVVMGSTYPRWENDNIPNFIENFVKWQADAFLHVRVIVPHYIGAKRKEKLSETISIHRFRYAIPYRLENIAYGEFKRSGLYPVKAGLYILSELWHTLLAGVTKRPVIINAHWLIPQGFIAAVLKPILRTNVVISIHGADVFTMNGKLMRALKKFALSRADAVICNSSATRDVCRDLLDREYYTIPMGVDVERFAIPVSRSPRDTLELLFVGRVVEEKGIAYVCEAVKQLTEQKVSVRLTIVGDGSAKQKIEEFVVKNNLSGVISFAGWVQHEKLPQFYANADVFVGPSITHENGWKEAFGLVFAEALAAGLPVITTDNGGIRDIVIDDVNGLVVPEKDATAIANAIKKLAGNPDLRDRLGMTGAKQIRENFSWEAVTNKYQEIFCQVQIENKK